MQLAKGELLCNISGTSRQLLIGLSLEPHHKYREEQLLHKAWKSTGQGKREHKVEVKLLETREPSPWAVLRRALLKGH